MFGELQQGGCYSSVTSSQWKRTVWLASVYWLKCQVRCNDVTLSVADNSNSMAANECKIVADNLHLCG
jgi:hypothetical protein